MERDAEGGTAAWELLGLPEGRGTYLHMISMVKMRQGQYPVRITAAQSGRKVDGKCRV